MTQPELPMELQAPPPFRFQPGDWRVSYPGWGLVLDFTVEGQPVGQGGITTINGHSFHSNAKKLAPWRDKIKHAVIGAATFEGLLPIVGPVLVERYFTVQQPKPKRVRQESGLMATLVPRFPIVKSALNYDIDHLDRAVFDSLQKSGIIGDDTQIVGGNHWKQYPGGPHPLCPSSLGARIRLYTER